MTHLELWLRERHRSPAWLARELGTSKDPMYLLATPNAQARAFHSVRFDILLAVAELTGIDPGTLVKDVLGMGEAVDGE